MPKFSKKKASLLKTLQAHQVKGEVAAKKRAQEETSLSVSSAKRSKTGSCTSASVNLPRASPSERKGKGKSTIPFYTGRRILLVGEGNFSFALSLLTTEPFSTTPQLLIATSYDSEGTCFSKYPEAKDIVDRIRALGAIVYFDVDATKLDKHKKLRSLVYDTVAFNFPHVGAGIRDQNRNIVLNQRLIIYFLQSVATLLAKGKDPSTVPGSSRKKRKREDDDSDDGEGQDLDDADDFVVRDDAEQEPNLLRRPPPTRGTVLITLRDAAPYTLWDITRLAKDPPIEKGSDSAPRRYKVVRSFAFRPDTYNGYEHRRTIGGATGFSANEDLRKGEGVCRTWEFTLRDPTNS